jgi:uncharacterized protein YndB with AHSA1/START domain
MKLVRNSLVGMAVLAVAVVVVAFMLPRVVTVERGTVIAAPPEKVFVHVNSLRRFNAWSPWYERDPTMEQSFDGPEEGVGAKMSWRSANPDVGSGRQEIVDSVPNERVRVALDFGDTGNGNAGYTLTPEGDGTKIVWDFRTDLGNNPVARYFGLMFDTWIGADYEKGLAKLKVLVESQP